MHYFKQYILIAKSTNGNFLIIAHHRKKVAANFLFHFSNWTHWYELSSQIKMRLA